MRVRRQLNGVSGASSIEYAMLVGSMCYCCVFLYTFYSPTATASPYNNRPSGEVAQPAMSPEGGRTEGTRDRAIAVLCNAFGHCAYGNGTSNVTPGNFIVGSR